MHLRSFGIAIFAAALAACAQQTAQAPSSQNTAANAAQQGSDAASFMRMGDSLYAKGALQAASKMYRSAIEKDAALATPYARLGDIAWQSGQLNAAAELYRQALQRDQANPDALLGRARALALADETDASMLLVNDLIATRGASDQALALKATLFDLGGDHASAQTLFQSALDKKPKDARLRTSLAYSNALAGDYRAAVNTLRVLGENQATAPLGQFALADIYALSGQTAVAMELRKAASGGNPVSDADRVFLSRLGTLAQADKARALYFRVLPPMARPANQETITAAPAPTIETPAQPEEGTIPTEAEPLDGIMQTPDAAPTSPTMQDLRDLVQGNQSDIPEAEQAIEAADPISQDSVETAAVTPRLPLTPEPALEVSQAGSALEFWVQMASFNTPEALEIAWLQLQQSKPDITRRLSPAVQKVDLEGKGTYHRLYAGGFEDREAAQKVCDVLLAEELNCVILKGTRQTMTLAEVFESN